jgi:hypothetical protein
LRSWCRPWTGWRPAGRPLAVLPRGTGAGRSARGSRLLLPCSCLRYVHPPGGTARGRAPSRPSVFPQLPGPAPCCRPGDTPAHLYRNGVDRRATPRGWTGFPLNCPRDCRPVRLTEDARTPSAVLLWELFVVDIVHQAVGLRPGGEQGVRLIAGRNVRGHAGQCRRRRPARQGPARRDRRGTCRACDGGSPG